MAMIVITGANGFLGSAVAKKALQDGIPTRGIVRSEGAALEITRMGIEARLCPGYTVDELVDAFKGATAIIHLVAIARGPVGQVEEVNVKLLNRVLDAGRMARVTRMIYISGLGVGMQGACSPALDAYFRSKEAGERLVKQSGMEFVIFRPSFIIGPGDGFTKVAMDAIASGYVHYTGQEGTIVQPIGIDDAASVITKAAVAGDIVNRVYDLVGSEEMTVDALVMAYHNAIIDANVNISPPVIKRVPIGQAAGIDESIVFLSCQAQGNPSMMEAALGARASPIAASIAAAVQATLEPDEPVPEKRAVMLFSGGLDSVTILYWMRSQGYEVIPLSMHYHNRPSRELKAVEHICKTLGIKVVDVPVPYIMEVLELKLAGYPVPSLFGSSDYYVPYRNLVFNAIATYFADIHGARYIISGHITSDPLPDANQAFFDSLELLVARLKVGDKAVAPKFLLPLKGKTKVEVVGIGASLGVPFEWTWSCAFDGTTPCGNCKPCRERAEAFAGAGLVDPVVTFRLTSP